MRQGLANSRKALFAVLIITLIITMSIENRSYSRRLAGNPGDKRPPRTVLVHEERRQLGRLREYCWTGFGNIPFYQATCKRPAGFFYEWPAALLIDDGEITLGIDKETPPDDVRVMTFRRVRPLGKPVGKRQALQVSFLPNLTRTSLGWVTTIDLKHRGHVYVLLEAQWRDDDGSGHTDWSQWMFHLNRKKTQ